MKLSLVLSSLLILFAGNLVGEQKFGINCLSERFLDDMAKYNYSLDYLYEKHGTLYLIEEPTFIWLYGLRSGWIKMEGNFKNNKVFWQRYSIPNKSQMYMELDLLSLQKKTTY